MFSDDVLGVKSHAVFLMSIEKFYNMNSSFGCYFLFLFQFLFYIHFKFSVNVLIIFDLIVSLIWIFFFFLLKWISSRWIVLIEYNKIFVLLLSIGLDLVWLTILVDGKWSCNGLLVLSDFDLYSWDDLNRKDAIVLFRWMAINCLWYVCSNLKFIVLRSVWFYETNWLGNTLQCCYLLSLVLQL